MNRIIASILFSVALSANAADEGVVLFDDAAALSGGVTAGDDAGYPITISSPGHYRLTSNLVTRDPSTTLINITASNVTLDLDGHSLIGPNSCAGRPVTSCSAVSTGSGIYASGQQVTVLNGYIRGMGASGVVLQSGSYVERIVASDNGDNGIKMGSGVIKDSQALYNYFTGIMMQGSGNVDNSRSIDNRLTGIQVGGGSLVTKCTSNTNGGSGIAGNINSPTKSGYQDSVSVGNLGSKSIYIVDLGNNL